jgi:molecular chaperone GrpE
MSGDSGSSGYTVRDRRWWAHPEEAAPEEPTPPTQVAALEAELQDRERRMREAQVREREAVLELDRARARLERDARKEIERARRELIVSLLPVLDDLDRAIAAAQGRTDDALLTGVEHVRSGFLDRLRSLGVERFEPACGEEFDPARHEAVSTVPARPGAEGTIVKTLRPGYAAGDDVIRAAPVVVAA